MFRIIAVAVLVPAVLAQDPDPVVADSPQPVLDQAALDAAFSKTMSNARLVGFFTEDGAEDPDALQENTYELGEVVKLESGKWRFPATIAYGGREFVFPLALDVEWAGDTPVITLTDMTFPMVGTFTSRVLIYADRFVGFWDGGGEHKGLMWGRIERAEAPAREPVPAPKEGDSGGDDEAGDGGKSDKTVHWPGFRGPRARGVSNGYPTATEWDVESGEGVRWSVDVPGLAHSSPVIWGDRIYVTSAVKEGDAAELKVGLYGSIAPVDDDSVHELNVYCLDKATGAVVWERNAWTGVPEIKRHPKGSHAASTPATDGEHVLAFFGSEGLYCYSKDGLLLWKKDFGRLDSGYWWMKGAQWGFASSPVISGDRVLVQCDIQDDSFVTCLDLETGREIWRTAREEVPTWGSPTVDVEDGRSQVICNGWKHIGAYDLRTGAELWKLEGGGDIPVPTPIVAGGLIFIMNAHGKMAPIYAIDAGARGELTTDHESMVWFKARRGNYMQTPLVMDGLLYGCSDAGILGCYDARTGEEVYRERLGGGGSGFTPSIIAASGKIYATSEMGEVFVVRAGREFEVLSVNSTGEESMATPAMSEGVLYWRTRGRLIAIDGASPGTIEHGDAGAAAPVADPPGQ